MDALYDTLVQECLLALADYALVGLINHFRKQVLFVHTMNIAVVFQGNRGFSPLFAQLSSS